MIARTLTDILNSTRQQWIENITLQNLYTLDASKTWDEQFSNVSLESIITYVFSYCIWIFENIVFDKSTEVVATIESNALFSIPWYSALAKAFQLGDELTYNSETYRYDYATVDALKQIIEFTAIRQRQIEGVTKLQVFATKANKAAMTVDELAAFSGYITNKGAAGTHFQFISLAPDQLVINADVYYNAQVLKSNGEKLSDGTKPVDLAVTDYLNNILYAGAFNRTKLTDKMQLADGVTDVVLGDVRLNGDLNNSREFESESGFYTATTITITYHAG